MNISRFKANSALFRFLLSSILTSALTFAGFSDTGKSEDSRLASYVIEKADLWRGLVSILGAEQAGVGLDLARTGDFIVHVIDPDPALVSERQSEVDVEGVYGRRLLIERSSFQQLPYVANSVDVVVATDLKSEDLEEVSLGEIVRVLVPYGKAILGSRSGLPETGVSESELEDWFKSEGLKDFEVESDSQGVWATFEKPPIEGADDWSHWEHGPGNHPVSNDCVVTAPYMTHYLGSPYYIAMPAITTAAGGRVFLAMGHIAHHKREEQWLNTLQARNGYNGIELWTRKLPDGYMVHRSAFIAQEDAFYMIDPSAGNGVLVLDPDTGDEMRRIRLRGKRGQWKWIAMKEGVLYALVGTEEDPAETTIVRSEDSHWSWSELSKGYYEKKVPWGFGNTLVAYDLENDELRWSHEEEEPIDSRSLVIGGGNVYYLCPDTRIGCLNRETGEVVWTSEDEKTLELIEEPGRGLSSTPGFRSSCYTIYTPKALVFEAETRMNVVAVSIDDGKMLWTHKKVTNNPNMLYLDKMLLVGIGEEGSTMMIDPETGEIKKDLGFKKRSCTRLTATHDSLFCRGWPEGTTRYDRNTGEVQFNGAFRPACNDGVIGANGLLYAGPWLCDCNLTLMGQIALTSAGDFQFDAPVEAEERLQYGEGNIEEVASLDVAEGDWTTYRAKVNRSAASPVKIEEQVNEVWTWQPKAPYTPTPPLSAGGILFMGGDEGRSGHSTPQPGANSGRFERRVPSKPRRRFGKTGFMSGRGMGMCTP